MTDNLPTLLGFPVVESTAIPRETIMLAQPLPTLTTADDLIAAMQRIRQQHPHDHLRVTCASASSPFLLRSGNRVYATVSDQAMRDAVTGFALVQRGGTYYLVEGDCGATSPASSRA